MIDYVGLNILAGIYALMLGYAIGRFFQDSHYRKLLRGASEGYNETIRELRKRNMQLEQDNLCADHDVQMLEEEVKDWKHKAAEWEAKARAFHEMAAGKDK